MMNRLIASLPILINSLVLMTGESHAADGLLPVVLKQLDDRVRVEIGGQWFTDYIFKGASRPYCYPVLATDGTPLTRDFPMKETAGEDTDHKHHRALMFVHSDVNGIDFWNEGTAGTRFPKGNTVHDGLLETTSGEVGLLRTRNRWVDPNHTLIATDETTIRFRGTADARMLDYEVTIHALPDTPLVMGDNKDGTMAIRVAQWLSPQHRGQVSPGHGHIVTATGIRDGDAWGTRADWCDYYAEHNGKIYGIALFDHPDNLRHPTWWMARDYGLFAANPFGQHHFEPDQHHPQDQGDYIIPAGGELTLRYRFCFHNGTPEEAHLGERYTEYAAGL